MAQVNIYPVKTNEFIFGCDEHGDVDFRVSNCDSVEEAKEKLQAALDCLNRTGFNLVK
jgi:hypothetical protein